VKLQARNSQHRLTIELAIVKAVEEVNAAGTRRRETDAKLPDPFGITAGIEGSGFFMADLNAGIRRALKTSMMPLMPYPGSPKTVSTFHLISVSTRTSPAVGVAMGVCLSVGFPRHRPRTRRPQRQWFGNLTMHRRPVFHRMKHIEPACIPGIQSVTVYSRSTDGPGWEF
jgi:hypothetical protein